MNALITISGDNTFYQCNGLINISMDALTTISGAATFYNCDALEAVMLPSLVNMSGDRTFRACDTLEAFSALQCSYIGVDTFVKSGSLKNCKRHSDATIDETAFIGAGCGPNGTVFHTYAEVCNCSNCAGEPTEPPSDSGLSTGAIIGIVVGTIVFLGGVVFMLYGRVQSSVYTPVMGSDTIALNFL